MGGQKEHAEVTKRQAEAQAGSAIEQLPGSCGRAARKGFPFPIVRSVQDRGREMPVRRRSRQRHRVGIQPVSGRAKDELSVAASGSRQTNERVAGMLAGSEGSRLQELLMDSPEVGTT